MSSSSNPSRGSSHDQDTTPFVVTLKTVSSNSSLDDDYSASCTLNIRNPKKGSRSKKPPKFDLFQTTDKGKGTKPDYNTIPATQSNTLYPSKPSRSTLPEHTFDQIEHLTAVAKHSSLTQSPHALDRIDDLADLTTRLAIELLEAKVGLESIKKAYEHDTTRVQSSILALRASKTKLEAERSHVQDLSTRMAGIRFDHMTSLAKYQVQKAEYEFRAREAMELKEKYNVVLQELDAATEEREKELIMMATQMWSLKMMVGDMFARSEWALRDGMVKACEEIDLTLERLDGLLNESIQSGQWGKKCEDGKGYAVASHEKHGKSPVLSPLRDHEAMFKLVRPKTREPEGLAWNDVENFMEDHGPCAVDDIEEVPAAMELNSKEVKAQGEPYWHEGEYRFWGL